MTAPRTPRLLCVLLVAGGLAASAAAERPAADPPRYGLEVGRHLVYEGDEVAELSRGRAGVERRTELRVIAGAADGTRRVVLTQRQVRFQEQDGQRTNQPARFNVFVVDVSPTGEIPTRASDSLGVLDRMLPGLPRDDALWRAGWTYGAADVRHACRKLGDGSTFEVVPRSAMWDLFGFSATATYRFDAERGVPTEIVVQHRYDGRDTRRGVERLVETRDIAPDEIAALAADAAPYASAMRAYRTELAAAFSAGPPDAVRAALAAAVAHLESVGTRMRSGLLRTQVTQAVQGHRLSTPRHEQRIQRHSALIGRPAPTWSLTDIGGDRHGLQDYEGRVVVLDFWYRRCGWCIRAMPQLEAVARRFADAPVAVLGMNTDADVADARFVVDRLHPAYPTLLADRTLAQAHGVSAYPTLLVLDPRGAVRHVHVGYSGTLEEELSEIITRLLDESDAAPAGGQ